MRIVNLKEDVKLHDFVKVITTNGLFYIHYGEKFLKISLRTDGMFQTVSVFHL